MSEWAVGRVLYEGIGQRLVGTRQSRKGDREAQVRGRREDGRVEKCLLALAVVEDELASEKGDGKAAARASRDRIRDGERQVRVDDEMKRR